MLLLAEAIGCAETRKRCRWSCITGGGKGVALEQTLSIELTVAWRAVELLRPVGGLAAELQNDDTALTAVSEHVSEAQADRTARVVITAFTHPLALETTLKAWVKYVSSMILGEACSGVEQSRYVRFNLVGRRAEIRRYRLHARV